MTRRKHNHSRRADGPPVLLVDLAMPLVGRHSGPSMLAHVAAAVAGGLLALAVLIVVSKTLPKGTSTQPVGGNVPPEADRP